MAKKITTTTTLRVTEETRDRVASIAKKEKISQKDCVKKLTELFINNNLTFKDRRLELGETADRLIRIMRGIEKDYIVPIFFNTLKSTAFIEELKNTTSSVEESEYHPYESGENINNLQSEITSSINLPATEIENKLRKAEEYNQRLVKELFPYFDKEKLTSKVVTGTKQYKILITEHDLDNIINMLEVCTIQ